MSPAHAPVAGSAMKFGFPLVNLDYGVIMKLPSKLLAPLILMAAVAHADGQPEQKLGLWQRTVQTTEDGKTESPEKSQHCVNAASLEMVKHALADAAKMCSRYALRQVGDKWILDSVCNFGTTKLTLHQETLMKGETAYHSETESTYSPPLSGGGHSRTVTDGVWIGPCKDR
jgi:hypothetical protein